MTNLNRPEVKRRIKETCSEALVNWYNANKKELDNKYYDTHEYMRQVISEESDFILQELKLREVKLCQQAQAS